MEIIIIIHTITFLKGYINIDSSSLVKPDIVADICKLPFKNSSVDEIYTAHTLEHVNDFEKAMKELHRVLKTGGTLKNNSAISII